MNNKDLLMSNLEVLETICGIVHISQEVKVQTIRDILISPSGNDNWINDLITRISPKSIKDDEDHDMDGQLECDCCGEDFAVEEISHYSGDLNGEWCGHIHVCQSCAMKHLLPTVVLCSEKSGPDLSPYTKPPHMLKRVWESLKSHKGEGHEK